MVGLVQFLDHSIMLDSILTISLLSQGTWPSVHMETSNPVPEVQIDSEDQLPSRTDPLRVRVREVVREMLKDYSSANTTFIIF